LIGGLSKVTLTASRSRPLRKGASTPSRNRLLACLVLRPTAAVPSAPRRPRVRTPTGYSSATPATERSTRRWTSYGVWWEQKARRPWGWWATPRSAPSRGTGPQGVTKVRAETSDRAGCRSARRPERRPGLRRGHLGAALRWLAHGLSLDLRRDGTTYQPDHVIGRMQPRRGRVPPQPSAAGRLRRPANTCSQYFAPSPSSPAQMPRMSRVPSAVPGLRDSPGLRKADAMTVRSGHQPSFCVVPPAGRHTKGCRSDQGVGRGRLVIESSFPVPGRGVER
jgi:hypothetical protein